MVCKTVLSTPDDTQTLSDRRCLRAGQKYRLTELDEFRARVSAKNSGKPVPKTGAKDAGKGGKKAGAKADGALN